ncbi:hypothetical protein CIL03_16865 [Virgibacillus indicus]|uniref:Uncharacterized protein n=1 Tax=Virgibacillus indicus TaxID=2024554 RepID=A0A265N644_9BACI|nr:hypothetical protein [Virgibacillus indicus]OZU87488.1 hypothetical protein CIL03_16865 [Virgibacillus indicus]
MWIRVQNKKELVFCGSFSISRNFGGEKKHSILGSVPNGFWGDKKVILVLYRTSDNALDELTRIQGALLNETKVFEMS